MHSAKATERPQNRRSVSNAPIPAGRPQNNVCVIYVAAILAQVGIPVVDLIPYSFEVVLDYKVKSSSDIVQ